MTKQLEHKEINTYYNYLNIVIICDNIKTPENIGQIIRICEAMAVESIIFCGLDHPLPNKTIRRVSRATDSLVQCMHLPNMEEAIKKMQGSGYHILALEITNDSTPLYDLQIPNGKIAIVIGNEMHGIDNTILPLCDRITHIPLYGQNSSINVAMALSICLYTLVSKSINQKDTNL